VTPPAPVHGCGNGSVASILVSDASLFYKNKQVNLKNKPKISNLTKKQAQHHMHWLPRKFSKIKNQQEN